MSNDVTFEELEKTAFEFAKSMSTGENLSRNAMRLAEKWHAESFFRESLYNAKRASWLQVKKGLGCSAADFIEDHTYWVITQDDNRVVQAKFSRLADELGEIQPMFYKDKNAFSVFAISHYIDKEEGDKIIAITPPSLLEGLEEKNLNARPIPTMRSNWQS